MAIDLELMRNYGKQSMVETHRLIERLQNDFSHLKTLDEQFQALQESKKKWSNYTGDDEKPGIEIWKEMNDRLIIIGRDVDKLVIKPWYQKTWVTHLFSFVLGIGAGVCGNFIFKWINPS
jgi:hypothetical protein